MISIALAMLLLIAGAWYGAEIFVLRDIQKLLTVAKRVRAGDLAARTGLKPGREELTQLGGAFDEMTQALRERDTKLHQMLQELQDQAITDPLTGLYNRRYLWDILPRELIKAERKAAPLALIILDIDHFKEVNDTYGHQAGDLVLMEIARLTKAGIRGSDTAYRYGGEEFVLVLPEITVSVARERAEKIRTAIADMELHHSGKPIRRVTVSLGVAFYPHHGHDPDSLLRAADDCLYTAKSNGRNQVVMGSTA
jgi:diguanylate cyclase (GGDEF)-like protein